MNIFQKIKKAFSSSKENSMQIAVLKERLSKADNLIATLRRDVRELKKQNLFETKPDNVEVVDNPKDDNTGVVRIRNQKLTRKDKGLIYDLLPDTTFGNDAAIEVAELMKINPAQVMYYVRYSGKFIKVARGVYNKKRQL